MKALLYISAVILPAVLIYLIGSFAVLSFSVHDWDVSGRLIAAFIWAILSALLCGNVEDFMDYLED